MFWQKKLEINYEQRYEQRIKIQKKTGSDSTTRNDYKACKALRSNHSGSTKRFEVPMQQRPGDGHTTRSNVELRRYRSFTTDSSVGHIQGFHDSLSLKG